MHDSTVKRSHTERKVIGRTKLKFIATFLSGLGDIETLLNQGNTLFETRTVNLYLV